MKHSFIKYEKLSNDIKQEIQNYYHSAKTAGKAVFDESMTEWFENKFDEFCLP